MFGKLLGFIVSVLGLLLPWRLRVIFSEILGWITQFVYYTYYGIFNYLLKELKHEEEGGDNEK